MESSLRKVALVTGASRGIGRAVAIELARKGYDLAVGYKNNQSAANETLAAVRAQGARGVALSVDLENTDSIQRLFVRALAEFSKLDLLVNNAGVNIRENENAFSEETFEILFNTNVKGLYLCSLHAFEAMKNNIPQEQSLSDAVPVRGRIINISAIPGRTVPPPGMILYGASKAAVDSLTRGLAAKWGPFGILVNAVAPGITETDIIHSDSDEVIAMLKQASVLRRLGRATDTARLVGSLAEDSWIVGQSINASGGRFI